MHGIITTSRNAEFRTHYTYYTELPYILNLKKSGITLISTRHFANFQRVDNFITSSKTIGFVRSKNNIMLIKQLVSRSLNI